MTKGTVAQEPLRIYVAGAHSTGKTTVARWIARTYGLPLVTEVARQVLSEMELPLPVLRVDLDRTRDFQKEVFRRQALQEDAAGPRFVSDRCCDNLAYASEHTLALREIAGDVESYAKRLRAKGSVVFFVRPHKSLVHADGTRAALDWEDIVRIDGMVKFMLDWLGVVPISMDTPSMTERARTVIATLRLLGLEPETTS